MALLPMLSPPMLWALAVVPFAGAAPAAGPARPSPSPRFVDGVYVRSPLSSSRRPQELADVVSRVENASGWIAITFDACATATQGYAFDWSIYRVLEQERVPATIFVSGHWVESHPDAMRALAGNPRIEFGNHSFDHPHMPQLAVGQMKDEVVRTEATLAPYGKRSVAFRPPFGELDARVVETVRGLGLPVVLWDVVSGDPSAKTTAEGMIGEVSRRTRTGSIVIFHINGRGAKTAEALPTILRHLRDKGLSFVLLSRLLAQADVAVAGNRLLPVSVESPLESPSGILCEPPADPPAAPEWPPSPSPSSSSSGARGPSSPLSSVRRAPAAEAPLDPCTDVSEGAGSDGDACR